MSDPNWDEYDYLSTKIHRGERLTPDELRVWDAVYERPSFVGGSSWADIEARASAARNASARAAVRQA